jgi:two-component system, chemotaxis family, CheB/CheR fusion protein
MLELYCYPSISIIPVLLNPRSLATSGEHLLTLLVANNGQELPPDFDISKIRSMGLNLVLSLIKQIKGDLAIKTGATTGFEITFPRSV